MHCFYPLKKSETVLKPYRFLFTVNMTAIAGCTFVTNSLFISRILDTFENISEVYINRAPINAKEL